MKRLILDVIFWTIEMLIRLAERIDWDLTHEVFRKFAIIALIKNGDLVDLVEE
jgi:hypothetical protein